MENNQNRITQLKREKLNLLETINIYDKEDGDIQDRLETIDKELNELENMEARQARINRLKRQRAFYLANSKKKEDMFKLEYDKEMVRIIDKELKNGGS